MSNLEDRSAARYSAFHDPGPLYPNLGPAVAKHRRLNDETPEGRKAYGQAVLKAINALNRQKLKPGFNPSAPCASGTWHSEGAAILKAVNAQNRAAFQRDAQNLNRKSDEDLQRDYYRTMLKNRGVNVRQIEDLQAGRDLSSYDRMLWLKAAWNVIKTKRGTPYLAEAGYVCGDGKRFATEAKAIEYANRVHLNAGIVIAVEREPTPQPEAIGPAPQPLPGPSFEASATAMAMGLAMRQPKKRGRPFGSKNKPKLVAEPVTPAEQPKPSKPRVPSHYLSSASSVAYHAAM
jgi:hypothetical protein